MGRGEKKENLKKFSMSSHVSMKFSSDKIGPPMIINSNLVSFPYNYRYEQNVQQGNRKARVVADIPESAKS